MIKKVFETARLFIDRGEIDIDGAVYKCVVGKHSIWVPDPGYKIVWSINGKAEAVRDWRLGRNVDEIKAGTFNENTNWDRETKQSIVTECSLLLALASENLMPRFYGVFYIKCFISKEPYEEEHCDIKGRYGFMIADATREKRGEFAEEHGLERVLTKIENLTPYKVRISEGAIGDLKKADNTVNGYLVDLRRTLWDMIKIEYPQKVLDTIWKEIFQYQEGASMLARDISKLTQFPHKKRKENYQSFWMRARGGYCLGSRNTTYRFDQMKISGSLRGKNVVDLGCNLGAVCIEAYLRGARKITGVELEEDYVNCARRLARHNYMPINFVNMSLTDGRVIEFLNRYYLEGIDVLFALSVYKHIKEALWRILKEVNWKVCYIESHNAPNGKNTGHVKEMIVFFDSMGYEVEELGLTEDRSPRYIWKLKKNS